MSAADRQPHRLARRGRLLARFAPVATAALLSLAVQAHEGDDHGAASGAASHSTLAEPRFVAESEAFELVGTLEGTRLVLWLDRWADNTPVRDARIELEVGGTKVEVRPRADDPGYEAQLPAPLPEGVHPVSAVIHVGNASDLVAGELDVHGAAQPPAASGAAARGAAARWSRPTQGVSQPWGAGAALLASAILAFAFLRRRARRGTGAGQ